MSKVIKFSTGDKIPVEEDILKDIPLIGELSFNEFDTKKEGIKGKPISCSQCGAILTDVKLVSSDPKVGTFFKCLYCGSINVIDPKDLPNSIDIIGGWYIPPTKSKSEFGEGIQKGNSLIAALDVSGSMSGSKLEGVKKSLISTLKAYSKSKEDAIFGIVTFESALRIYSSDGEVVETLTGNILYDVKELEKKAAENSWVKKQLPKMTIKSTGKDWQNTIQKMVSLGSTALGPAVIVARIMSLTAGTGRILLLTDGMANEGVGSLSGSSPEGKAFYKQIGEELKRNGIVLDLVGIQGEDSLELKTLAQLPELTGGDLFYADLAELSDSFSLIAGDEIIGRNARIKVIVPEEIELSNLSGAGAHLSEIKKGKEVELGGLTKSRSVSFEFKHKKKIKERQTIPVQVQVFYKDEHDNERIKVIERELEVTDDKKELEKNINADLVAGYTVQRAAQEMQHDRKKGKVIMEKMMATLSRSSPKAAEAQQYLKNEIDEMDDLIEREERGEMSAGDAIQSSSYRMVKKRQK